MLKNFAPLFLLALLASSAGCGDDDGSGGGSAGAGGAPTGEGGASGEGGGGDEAVVLRGKYLVDHVIACPDCHTPRDAMGAPIVGEYMAGSECLIRTPEGDCLNAPNLTNHETGLKNRTDDEIETMIRDGLRPSATGDEPLNPMMPYYVFHNIAPADMDAIIAYLRSLPAVDKNIPPSAELFAVPAPVNPLDPATIPLPASDYAERESALRGRYLATQSGACIECHTPHKVGSLDVLDPDEFFMGGEEFPIGLPATPISANLTSDATGLKGWTAEDIVRVLKQGVDPEGEGLCPPMPVGPMGAYAGLTDEDALDIANYLLSLPPIENEIADMCSFPP